MKSQQKNEMLSKLQLLNLSSSSSETSYDARFKISKPNNQNLIRPSQVQKNFNDAQILKEKKWETNNDKKKNINSRKMSKHYEDKENIDCNLNSNSFDDSEMNSNKFYFSRNLQNQISQNLSTSPSLSKKIIDQSFEDDPLKIYEQLKEKISKEIKHNKQMNEQYKNEVNFLKFELNQFKLKDQSFQRDIRSGIQQTIPFSNLSNINHQNTLNQINNSQQMYYLPQALQIQYNTLDTKQSYLETQSNYNENRSSFYDIQANQLDKQSTYQSENPIENINNNIKNKVPFLFHSFSNLENSMKLKNKDKIQIHKSMQDNNYLKIEDYELNDNLDKQNNEQLQDQEQKNQKLTNQQKLQVIINHSQKNSISKQKTVVQQQKNDSFWKKLEQKRQSINLIKKTKYISNDESDFSQENDIDNDVDNNHIKSVYEHNQNEDFVQQSQIVDITSQQFENQIPTKQKMKIKPLQLGSEQDNQLKFTEKTPLQNLRIKEQENNLDSQQIIKNQKKLKSNPVSQKQSFKQEAIIQRKSSTAKSFETLSQDKKQINSSNQSSKQQSPSTSKKQVQVKQTKKIKPLVEQSGLIYLNQNYTKKISNPQLNNLQIKKMNTFHHSKAQINTSENPGIKKKVSCNECISLLRKGISTTYCTQQHNQK